MSSGLARLRGMLLFAIRGTPPAPVASVEESMASSVEALTLRHVSEAARRTARSWSEQRDTSDLLARDPTLWSASPETGHVIRDMISDWMNTEIDVALGGSGTY